MTKHQSHSPGLIKNKMRLLRLPRFAQRKSISTSRRLHRDSSISNGQRDSKDGTRARSLTARIIRPLHVRSPEHGARILAIGEPRSSLQSFPIKTCAESAKRLRRLVSSFCYRKFEASAPLIQKSYQTS